MRLVSKSPVLWLPIALAAGSAALALAAVDTTLLGWAPVVSLWDGDVGLALRSLRDGSQAYHTVLHRTEIDAPTQTFLDRSLEEFENFDLDGLYDLLPEKRDGFRELLVRGDLAGPRYLVRRAARGTPYEVGVHASRHALADMSATLRVRPHVNHGEHRSYLIGGRFGLGIGNVGWRELTDASADFLRLTATADPRAGAAERPLTSAEARAKVKALHPGLGEEDVDVLALLFEAYPQTTTQVASVVRIEDVRVAQVESKDAPPAQAGATYQHVTVRMRAMPSRLKARFPHLAKHLDKLGDLAWANLRWVDSQGRNLVLSRIETDRLLWSLDCYVKDGQLLPFRRTHVFVDEPVDLMSNALKSSRLLADLRMQVVGVIIKLDQLRVDLRYEARESYGSIGASVTSIPGIRVEGRALGFLPTRVVDAFIPGNIEGLTREFFEVAVKGNNNKGIVIQEEIGSATPGAPGVIAGSFDLEALDNFMVNMGVRMINDRVIPNDDTIRDQKRLAAALHDAFVHDLARFHGRAGGHGEELDLHRRRLAGSSAPNP